MTTEELKNMLTEKFRLMSVDERAEAACKLYGMEIIDREDARKLLGIDEEEYLERAMFGAWYSALEDRFESLSDEFLSGKHMEIVKENGEY